MSSVDIVVPCYNYGRFLGECVESILSQEGVDLRVLIIDDASTDDSARVGSELAASDERVTFLRHEANAGHIATYNEGIDWAEAEFWMLISADDLLAPGALARALWIADRHPEIGLVYGKDIPFSASEELVGIERSEGEEQNSEVISGREFIERSCRTASNLVPTPTAFVRTSLLRQVGGYRSELPMTADMELQFQIAIRSAVGITDCVQAYKRIHLKSMGRQDFATRRDEIEGRKAAFDWFFRTASGLEGTGPRELQRRAEQRLAQDAFWYASLAFDRGDIDSCKNLLSLSKRIDSRAISHRNLLGLRLKRSLGPALWRKIGPLLE